VAGDLAAGLTHELKNSLAGIKISIEVLLDELSLSDEDRNVLKGMIREVRRIELLMRDILSFARPSRPHFSYVNINAILDTSMTFSLKNVPVAADGSLSIKVVKDFDELLPKTMVDPMQLQQVFMNLLINAVESMPAGGSITVKTRYDAPEDFILISISDTGKGVDKELTSRIFEPFFTTKPKGTGLGLPITKRLIEQHGGVMSIENNSSGGATFSIILPVKHAEEVNVT
jgi:signal transduction histidine kinase